MPEDKDKYNRPRKKIPNYKREPGKLPTFEIDPNSEKVLPEALEAAERYRKIKNKSEIDPNSEIVLPEKLIKAAERYRKIKNKSSDFPMSKEGSPTVTDTETGETTFGRPRKFSSGELADLIGPSKPKGSVSPKIRAYDDDFQSTLGAGVNLTTKKGVSFDFDVDKTNYKNSDYKEPESYKASVSKQGEKFSYGASGTKKGKSSRVEAGFTFKYKDGGMTSCRGMGKAVKGGKFTGVK
jgi:hypothetical protein